MTSYLKASTKLLAGPGPHQVHLSLRETRPREHVTPSVVDLVKHNNETRKIVIHWNSLLIIFSVRIHKYESFYNSLT
jgi:hypothetical protein